LHGIKAVFKEGSAHAICVQVNRVSLNLNVVKRLSV